jgi:hypothetical protein
MSTLLLPTLSGHRLDACTAPARGWSRTQAAMKPRRLRYACERSNAGVDGCVATHSLFASRGYAVGPAGVGRADPTAFDLSRQL